MEQQIKKLELSKIGFGCWQLGSSGVNDYWGVDMNQEQADSLINECISNNILYLDTAEAYSSGKSEIQLGQSLLKLNSEQRKKVIIGTKILPNNCNNVRQHCLDSLNRLQVDSIDIYMVHWAINQESMNLAAIQNNQNVMPVPNIKDAFKELQKLQQEGKIKYIGVSNFGIKQLQEVIEMGITIAVNQLCYNLLFRAIEYDILPFCINNNIQVLSYSPLMQGILTGAFNSNEQISKFRTRSRHFDSSKNEKCRHGEQGHEELVFQTIEEIIKIGKEHNLSVCELALAWPLHQKGVSTVIVGATKTHQVVSNAKAAYLQLNHNILQQLDKATQQLKQAMGSNCDLWQNSLNSRIY